MIRRVITLALLAMGLAAVPLATQASAAPPTLPPGFSAITYDAGMFQYDLTNILPVPGSNRLIATGKGGRVVRVDIAGDGLDSSDATTATIAQLPVYSQGDRGLLGITTSSDYLTSGHLFLLYDYC